MNGDELYDFEGFAACRSGDLNFVADLTVEKSFADGRGGGDVALFGVDFLTANEFVLDFDVFVRVENENAGAVAGAVFRNVGEIEHAEVAHAFFKLADARVDKALALLGVFVLGIFGKVAVGAGDRDFFGKFDVELVLELVDFFLKLLFDLCDRVRHCNPPKRIRAGGKVQLDERPRAGRHYRCGGMRGTRREYSGEGPKTSPAARAIGL